MAHTLSKIAIAAVVAAGFSAAAHADTVVRAGTGNQTGIVHPDDNKWYRLGAVKIRPKYSGTCLVWANGNTNSRKIHMEYTISMSDPPPTPSWVNANWDFNGYWRTWSMHQAFQVKRGQTYKFYAHARSHLGTSSTKIEHEFTRISAICGKGGKVRPGNRPQGEGPNGPEKTE